MHTEARVLKELPVVMVNTRTPTGVPFLAAPPTRSAVGFSPPASRISPLSHLLCLVVRRPGRAQIRFPNPTSGAPRAGSLLPSPPKASTHVDRNRRARETRPAQRPPPCHGQPPAGPANPPTLLAAPSKRCTPPSLTHALSFGHAPCSGLRAPGSRLPAPGSHRARARGPWSHAKGWPAALAGNRTRVNCLEGSYAHHYTTNAAQPGPPPDAGPGFAAAPSRLLSTASAAWRSPAPTSCPTAARRRHTRQQRPPGAPPAPARRSCAAPQAPPPAARLWGALWPPCGSRALAPRHTLPLPDPLAWALLHPLVREPTSRTDGGPHTAATHPSPVRHPLPPLPRHGAASRPQGAP
ncbi:uncharacterized protein LOC125281637 [Ursus arctos]|uniref:uncharacterized protein LOC125281637 n=1 Tax=Ursus arctos TaxID=9644 RepID=UPI0020178220|nr:uncharacterized protein LOC125281637 [Ursus arctos]